MAHYIVLRDFLFGASIFSLIRWALLYPAFSGKINLLLSSGAAAPDENCVLNVSEEQP